MRDLHLDPKEESDGKYYQLLSTNLDIIVSVLTRYSGTTQVGLHLATTRPPTSSQQIVSVHLSVPTITFDVGTIVSTLPPNHVYQAYHRTRLVNEGSGSVLQDLHSAQ